MRMGYSRYEHENSYYGIYRYDNTIIMQWEQLREDGSFRVRSMFGDTTERYFSMGKSAWGGVDSYTDFIKLIDWIESTSETDLVEHEPAVVEEFCTVSVSHFPEGLKQVFNSEKELLIRMLNWKFDRPTFYCIYEFKGHHFVSATLSGKLPELFIGTEEGTKALAVSIIENQPHLHPRLTITKTIEDHDDWDYITKLLVEKFSSGKIFKY